MTRRQYGPAPEPTGDYPPAPKFLKTWLLLWAVLIVVTALALAVSA